MHKQPNAAVACTCSALPHAQSSRGWIRSLAKVFNGLEQGKCTHQKKTSQMQDNTFPPRWRHVCRNIRAHCFSCIHDPSPFDEYVFLVLYHLFFSPVGNRLFLPWFVSPITLHSGDALSRGHWQVCAHTAFHGSNTFFLWPPFWKTIHAGPLHISFSF